MAHYLIAPVVLTDTCHTEGDVIDLEWLSRKESTFYVWKSLPLPLLVYPRSQVRLLLKVAEMSMETSAPVKHRYEELLFYAACVCNCWGLCLCVCVCLEGRTCRRGGGGGMRMGSSWRWQLSRAMRLALRWCRLCRPQRGGGRGGGSKLWISGKFLELWSYSKLLLKSLYFNSLSNSDTLLDCAFEPVYWIVDNVTRWFGVVSYYFRGFCLHLQTTLLTLSCRLSLSQVFVSLVILLTTSVVVIVYLFVLPTILGTYPVYWIIWHLCCGHWLLVMVVFHYYKATTTSPGHPPKVPNSFC